jgi:hypothetical protein
MAELLADRRGRIDAAAGMALLDDRAGAPLSILRTAEEGSGRTMASLVFAPRSGRMLIRFRDEPAAPVRAFSIATDGMRRHAQGGR